MFLDRQPTNRTSVCRPAVCCCNGIDGTFTPCAWPSAVLPKRAKRQRLKPLRRLGRARTRKISRHRRQGRGGLGQRAAQPGVLGRRGPVGVPPERLDQLDPAERRLGHRQPERHRHPQRQPLGDDGDQVSARDEERQRQEARGHHLHLPPDAQLVHDPVGGGDVGAAAAAHRVRQRGQVVQGQPPVPQPRVRRVDDADEPVAEQRRLRAGEPEAERADQRVAVASPCSDSCMSSGIASKSSRMPGATAAIRRSSGSARTVIA